MRIRLKFKKTGRLKYIGHLDTLNIFNRAIKSAKLPVMYSKGFNPHMLVVFAAPLPLGLTSSGEYVDIDFEEGLSVEEITARLNQKFPEGLEAYEGYVLAEPYKRTPALVTKALYRINGLAAITPLQIDSFMEMDSIEIMKKTKKKCALVNIRPDILRLSLSESSLLAELSCGSKENLKPTLFLEAFFQTYSMKAPLYKLGIERLEIFGKIDDQVLPLYKCI